MMVSAGLRTPSRWPVFVQDENLNGPDPRTFFSNQAGSFSTMSFL